VGEDTTEIERQIAAERSDLGRNLHELEDKAKALTNWRVHYRNHTGAALGLAFGGGLLLGVLMSGDRRTSGLRSAAEDVAPPRHDPSRLRAMSTFGNLSPVVQRVISQMDEVWPSIVDALVGVGAAKAVDLIGRYVPGFRDQLDQQNSSRSTVH
jgi:hypothetical protein